MIYEFTFFLVIAFVLFFMVMAEKPGPIYDKAVKDLALKILGLILVALLVLGAIFFVAGPIKKELSDYYFKDESISSNSGLKSLVQSNWDSGFYVDEFGDLTNNAFGRNTVKGKFDNTFTENSEFRVEMFIDNGDVFNHRPWFRIYTYDGTSPEKEFWFDYTSMSCRIKNQNNIISDIDIRQDKGNDDFHIISDEKIVLEFRQLIVDEGKASFACKDDRYEDSKYRFKFDFKGYYELYNKIKFKPQLNP